MVQQSQLPHKSCLKLDRLSIESHGFEAPFLDEQLVEARQAVQQHLLVIIQNTTGPGDRQDRPRWASKAPLQNSPRVACPSGFNG